MTASRETFELASKEGFGLPTKWGWVVFRGVIAILFGLILTAIGMTYESGATTVIGILLLALGAILLTLKIIRRNQGSQLP